MGRLFAPNATQPAGWLMTATVLILMGAAYAAQRRIIVLAQSAARSSQAVCGGTSGVAWTFSQRFLFACSILLLVLPAVLLVLLGPAIVAVLEAGLYL